MLPLKDKKILFISPRFFGYEQSIYQKLVEFGAEVTYIDDRPKNNVFTKFLIRYNFHQLYYKEVLNYFRSQIDFITHDYFDYVFVNTPEGLTYPALSIIKKKFPRASYILYMWDSFKNRKKAHLLLPFFDRVFSFDSEDSQNFRFDFRPLFFIDLYDTPYHRQESMYNLSFIGTAHTDRYLLAKKVEALTKNSCKNSFYYFYLQSPLMFLYRKIIEKPFRQVRQTDISYNSLSQKEVASIIKNSEVVLDIHHPNQKGLTMRTLEVLGARRKLITTNAEIKKYDFYNPSNIFIVDRQNVNVDSSFFKTPFIDYRLDIYHKYSLAGWVEEIFAIKSPRE